MFNCSQFSIHKIIYQQIRETLLLKKDPPLGLLIKIAILQYKYNSNINKIDTQLKKNRALMPYLYLNYLINSSFFTP